MSGKARPTPSPEVVTVTLNPAIDQTVTISNFAAGAVNRVEQMRSDPGGKGVNVAAALADFGHRVAVTGFLGRENAVPFETLFARKGIADHFVRIAGQTRVGIKVVDPLQRQTTDINFPGQAPTPADEETLVRRLVDLDAPWVVLAGSLPPGVAPTLYGDLVRRLRARGRRVALDTSGEALRHGVAAGPTVAKPNLHELETLVGASLANEAAVVRAARRLLGAGVELIVVSMGASGAWFVTEESAVAGRPPAVEVRSTVGAGDALVAGIVAAQLRELPLEACARLATAFSLDAITHLGAGLSSAGAIETLMDRVRLEVPSKVGAA